MKNFKENYFKTFCLLIRLVGSGFVVVGLILLICFIPELFKAESDKINALISIFVSIVGIVIGIIMICARKYRTLIDEDIRTKKDGGEAT